MKQLHILLVFITLFAFSNVCDFYGVNVAYLRAACLAVGLLVLVLPHGYTVPSSSFWLLLILVSIETARKLFGDGSDGARTSALQVCGTPILLCAIIRTTCGGAEIADRYIEVWRSHIKLFFFFYLLVVGIAILEGIIGHPFFGFTRESYENVTDDFTEYRSSSLLGHPLQNALVVSTIMSFILVSSLRAKYKYSLWILGYVAILFFNSRSSMVGNALLLGAYLLYTLFIQKGISMTKKISILCLSLVVVIVGLYLIFRVGMGGRLLEMGLFDDKSAQARVDAWYVFKYIHNEDLIYGATYTDLSRIMRLASLQHLENYWIIQSFEHGIIFMIIYVILWYNILRHLYRSSNWFNALYTIGAFLLFSSTNNSLSSDFLPLFIFVFCIILFKEDNLAKIVPRKYLE